MKYYVTKYALTQGILEVEGYVDADTPSMLVQSDGHARTYYHGKGRDWHETREGAVQKAEVMRKSKIASMQQQIKRLQTMKF